MLVMLDQILAQDLDLVGLELECLIETQDQLLHQSMTNCLPQPKAYKNLANMTKKEEELESQHLPQVKNQKIQIFSL